MSTETPACVHTARQHEERIVEAIRYLAGMPGVFVPFYAIQARTGIPPCELGPILDRLIEAGTLQTSALGGYALGACPHTATILSGDIEICAGCGLEWP